MSQENKHTPLPWKQDGFSVLPSKGYHGRVADCRTKEDAELITRTSNSNGELVEALKAFLAIDDWHDETIASRAIVEQAQMAIVNAEDGNKYANNFHKLFSILAEGEDIISGLEAEADNAGIDLSEARDWWNRANVIMEAIRK